MKLNLAAIRKKSGDPDRPAPTDLEAYRRWIKESTLDEKIEELGARRRAAARQLAEALASRESIRPGSGYSDLTRRAEILLDGRPRPVPAPPVGLIERLQSEIAEIDEAVKLANQRREMERLERIGGEIFRRMDEWNSLALRRVMALADLRRVETQCQEFLTSLVGPYGRPAMPTGQFILAGIFTAGSPARMLIDEAVRLNLITQKESQ